jgi:hypothetical protein
MQTTLGFALGKLAAFVAASLIVIVIVAWLSALAGVSFVRVHTEIGIDASPETVWAVISDFERYPEWNPLMVKVSGRPAEGERMEWTSVIENAARDYNAAIDRAVPNRELAWTGPVSTLARSLFWGHHQLIIEPQPAGSVRFVNTEGFGGIATLVVRGFLRNQVRRAYDAHNSALKSRAEALGARR